MRVNVIDVNVTDLVDLVDFVLFLVDRILLVAQDFDVVEVVFVDEIHFLNEK